MKLTTAFALGASVHCVAGHYVFGHLIWNGKWTEPWEYVRKISPSAPPRSTLIDPITDVSHTDMRCGRNASSVFEPMKTATVKAGDRVGIGNLAVTVSGYVYDKMHHEGFASAWLSRAPEGVKIDDYKGNGDWVKILMVTNRTEQSTDPSDWGTLNLKSYNFTIPKRTPPGQYLLRWEHVYPRDLDKTWEEPGSQFYIACAQIEVSNDGPHGVPGPTVKIPGHYTKGQPDVFFLPWNVNPNTFVPPKPEVWSG